MRLKLPDNQMPDDGNMLKRRLLGAAVLIAVAVIALPLLLDGAGSESRFRRVEQLRQEPPRIVDAGTKAAAEVDTQPPAVAPDTAPEAPVAKPKPAAPAASKAAPKQPVALSAPEPEAKEPIKAVPPANLTEAVAPAPVATAPVAEQSSEVVDKVAWVIQAGSYSAEENALALRARLRTAGFPSFVSKGSNQGAAVYRVKVGPLNNRQRATRVQVDVEALLGQSTLIRQYP